MSRTPCLRAGARRGARRTVGAAAIATILVVSLADPGIGDDRNLFRAQNAPPYVMMLLDVSDSMTWAPADDGMARASGDDPGSKLYAAKSAIYEVVSDIETGTALGFAHFRQAGAAVRQKRWIYRRADTVSNANLPWYSNLPWPPAGMPIDFGDELRISTNASTSGLSGTIIDDANEFVFPLRSTSSNIESRKLAACKDPDDQNESEWPGMSDNDYRLWRLAVYPKLGPEGTFHTWMYTQRGSNRYEIHVFPLAGGQKPYQPGGTTAAPFIDVSMTVRRVTCSTFASSITYPAGGGSSTPTVIRMVPHYSQDFGNPPFPFTGVFDYISRHGRSDPASSATDFHDEHNFHIGRMEDYTVNYTCDAADEGGPWWGEGAYWEPNNNPASTGAVSYATFADPYGRNCPNGCLDRGDIVPWDWKAPTGTPGFQHPAAKEIAWRMAPNLSVGETVPDFRIARYFRDVQVGTTLPLEDAYNPALRTGSLPQRYPPLLAHSYTPLGGMLDNFRDWYDDWVTVAADPDTGDPRFECRQRYAILLTDGAETCGTDGPGAAEDLLNRGIRTFVIGFGAGVTADDLNEIADAGGTGAVDTDNDGQPDCLQFETCSGTPQSIRSGDGVIVASTRDELVEALEGLLEVVNLEPATFATGAVPTGQSDAEDTVALTGFQPLEASSVWPGAINQFVRPLALVSDGQGGLRPDTSKVCGGSITTGCLAWNAGIEIRDQAPTLAEVATDRMIGTRPDQRRVTYTVAGTGVPLQTRPFDYPATADEQDLWDGLGLSGSDAQKRLDAQNIIRETLRIKQTADPRDPTAPGIDYVLGDSFHSDPRLVGGPQDFFKLANDLEGNDVGCFDTSASTPNRGYRCFFEKHRFRRQILVVGSNDGQIHGFDAGRFSYRVVSRKLEGEIDAGTGHELFAHTTRAMLPHIADLIEQPTTHQWGVDGPIVVDDVFVDPIVSGAPVPGEREWRSLMIGGYREGGTGYYAMDITQPDHLELITVDNFLGASKKVSVPTQQADYVPSCATNYSASLCGPLPYASIRWEFTDACVVGTAGCLPDGRSDEDLNGHPDLGYTWSKVNTGRVLVSVAGEEEVRYVAIFGGGLDPDNLLTVGNFLYMVDMETGSVLYKRALDGGVPSEPAAVDTDQNGLLDTIYIGTVAGSVYKVDIADAATIDAAGRVANLTEWAPLRIFETGGRPIFLPPTVTFISDQGTFALGFGTGDREDLWSTAMEDQGRFYMIVDTGFTAANLPSPLHETDYIVIEKDDLPTSGNLLVNPLGSLRPGWILRLDPLERVTSEAFAISGLLVFNSYLPEDDATGGVCSVGGTAGIYTLLATNANALSGDERLRTTEGFASSPYASPASVSNDRGSGGGSQTDDPFDTTEIRGIRESLKSLFPPSCKFGGFGVRLASNISNTSYFAIAEVPVCIVEKNWKEF
jgi:hypothetical protein